MRTGPPQSSPQTEARTPWLLLAALLGLCLAHGLRITQGLPFPPDLDALRDIGFTQGLLDSNWLGDPTISGAIRYYPPLIPALMALVATATSSHDLPGLWIVTGPWLGLLPVLAMFLFARGLFGATAALCAAICFALLNSAFTDPWIGGGYSPWLLTPLLAQTGLLATAWLIHARIGQLRWISAPPIGAAIGLTFLAHPVPAIILTIALTGTVFMLHGLHLRGLLWLMVTGAVQVAVMAPYLLPLLLAYPNGVIHLTPGQWTAAALTTDRAALIGLAQMNLPWIAAAIVLIRLRAWPNRAGTILLSIWIGVCVLALARHYACGADDSGLCRLLHVPAHHYHLALQVAGATLIGGAAREIAQRFPQPRQTLAAAIVLLAFGTGIFLTRPYDNAARDGVLPDRRSDVMDLAFYRWLLTRTPPDALFVTDQPTDRDSPFDPGAFAVMAAGRTLAAPHTLFSNPYVDWVIRERNRQALLAWTMGLGCTIVPADTWAILATDTNPAPARTSLAFVTATHRIFKLAPNDACTTSPPQ